MESVDALPQEKIAYIGRIYDMARNDNRYHLYAAVKDSSMIVSLYHIFLNI
jgi:hypothetical protein